MSDPLASLLEWLQTHPGLESLVASLGLLFAAWLANWLVKRILVHGLLRMMHHLETDAAAGNYRDRIVKRVANVCPALVVALGTRFIPGLPDPAITVVINVASAFIVLTLALAIGAALDMANALYSRKPDANLKPIKGYLQVVKIAIYALTTILMIATLIDRSPLILLSGLGAMAAVLLLIFQDTLLSLVASVQISSNDIVRVGDWIEMPQLHADGNVTDIALHTITVQNFDMTITTIPTKRILTESFRNWRGMQASGGRRIKRSLLLDQQSVHFLDDTEYTRLVRFHLLSEYLATKRSEITDWNARLADAGKNVVNTRRITNIGTFRAYVQCYLRKHPGVHQAMTLLVRQLSPTADGLPLEVYCFTNTVVWAEYESIQSDIFDHLLAIIPEFGLKLFQHPGGTDVQMAALSINRPET
jgi:miniconductance mechanosensitive channel